MLAKNIETGFPLPADEAGRLEALQRYDILDTPEEEAFDCLTRLATRMLNVPIALVSLMDADRQWFKSVKGWEGAREGDRRHAFCAHALCGEANLLYIPDARTDARFACNPLVTGAPRIRFYAGAPLTTHDGHRLGTFCVIDRAPRPVFDEEERATLEDLAAVAMALIEQRIEQRLRKTAERKAVEQAREAEAATRRLEETLDTISQGMTVFDDAFNLRFANRALLKLQSFPPEYRENGRPFADFIRHQVEHGEFGVHAIAEVEIARLTAMARNPEGSVLIGKRRNGRVLEVRTLPLSDGGFVTTHTDITAIKEAERMKDEFISTVSHELRTPLAAISGALSLMEVENLPERAERLRAIAATNAVSLGRLVSDVLDIERLVLGRLVLHRQAFDLEALVRQSIESLAPFGDKYGVHFALSHYAGPAMVTADPDRIGQVLANLLSNAAKFSPLGEIVTVALEGRPGHVRVSVADRGPGIPEDFKARIFEKFAQAGGSDASNADTKKEGVGLGLSIARMLVEAHKGRIGFEDRDGGGTMFWFELPLRES